ncbi:MAG: hypothetical protein ACJ8NS_06770 [Chthoniobacterales bacterium]
MAASSREAFVTAVERTLPLLKLATVIVTVGVILAAFIGGLREVNHSTEHEWQPLLFLYGFDRAFAIAFLVALCLVPGCAFLYLAGSFVYFRFFVAAKT